LHRLKYSLEKNGIEEIPEGVYVWVRISAVNNVDLMSNYPGTNVFMIDRSPPLPGEVNDGRLPHPPCILSKLPVY
jgi:hypothetical protein